MTSVFILLRSTSSRFIWPAMKTETPAYKRVVLKLSGEALQERGARENISPAVVREIADRIKDVHSLGVQISIVIGGGNIWRGRSEERRVGKECLTQCRYR